MAVSAAKLLKSMIETGVNHIVMTNDDLARRGEAASRVSRISGSVAAVIVVAEIGSQSSAY